MSKKQRFLGMLLMLLFTASVYAQSISVSYERQPLTRIFSDLRTKTGYDFFCQKQILEGTSPITLKMENASLTEVLDRIFYQTDLDYEIIKKGVVVHKRDKKKSYQKRIISGIVVDENSDPLPGANIRIEGMQTGTICDIDGHFSLEVDGKSPLLLFSIVGMKSKEVLVTSKTPAFITIELQPDVQQLGEVVVTGYQKIKRENVTGAFQTISADDMDQRYSADIVSNLEGKVPGLVSYRNRLGETGEETMTIRGISSFAARTNPLVVVDGLPIEGSMSTINPYEIESITVLKDASAASIYGARASNGVIVITTKQAKEKKLSIDFNTDLTISEKQSYDNYDLSNGSELMELEQANFDYVKNNTRLYNTLLSTYNTSALTLSPMMQLMMGHHLGNISDSDYQTQLDRWGGNNYQREWRDLMLRNQVLQQYNLALRTKGELLNSSIVIGYRDDNTGLVKQYNRKLFLSYKGDLKANKWLNLSFGLSIDKEKDKASSTLYNYKDQYAFPAYLSMYNEDGSLSPMSAEVDLAEPSLANSSLGLKSEAYNLVEEKNRNFTKNNQTNLRAFVHANATILRGWKASLQFQYEDVSSKSESYYEPDSYDMRHIYNMFTYQGEHAYPSSGALKTNNQTNNYYTFRAQTDYNRTFNKKHAIEALVGFEFRETHSRLLNNALLGYDEKTQTNSTSYINMDDLQYAYYTDLGVNFNYKPMAAAGYLFNFSSSDVLHRFYSYYLNANYTYDRRYNISASYRVDKTDLFGADPKYWGRPLWSTGVSWNISNENFMKKVRWVNFLKMRASYGLTGNIASNVSSYLTATVTGNYIIGENKATLNTPPNDQLRWEKTASFNVGIDFALLGNRLNGSFDWYRKNSSDLLKRTQLDTSTGWSTLNINDGKALNTGIEVQLNGVILPARNSRMLGVNASFGFGYNKNEVTSQGYLVYTGYNELLTTYHKGYPLNSIFAFRYGGLVLDNDGNQQVVWLKKDGTPVSNESISSTNFELDDVVYKGSLDPRYTANFTPEITWRNFSLSAMFAFYGGHYMRAGVDSWMSSGNATGYKNAQMIPRSYLNYWRSDDKTAYPANGAARNSTVMPYTYMQYGDMVVMPADYLKVRNIVIGYQFPKVFCKKLGVNGIRLRAQINNVATWVRNSAGIDPEANNQYSGTTLNETPRSYTMSLKVNL